jgi:hypothetical protein
MCALRPQPYHRRDVKRQGLLLTLICAMALSAAAEPAGAAATRAEYAAEVNAICVAANQDLKERLGNISGRPSGNKADEDLSKGERRRQLNRLGRSFTRLLLRVTRAGGRTITAVAAVTAAPGDEALVSQWVASLQRAQRLSKRSNRVTVRFLKSLIEFFLTLEDVLVTGDGSPAQKPTKADRRKAHRFVRIANALDRQTSKLLDEISLSSELALQLGATRCGGDTDPNAAAARVLREVRALTSR